jgi:hypothetical protein
MNFFGDLSNSTSIIKYNNFLNNDTIPNFEWLVFVCDIQYCNQYFDAINSPIKFDLIDYENDNIIIFNYNNVNIGFVYVYDNHKQNVFNNGDIMYWLRIKQFIGIREVVLFEPEQNKICKSLIEPKFSFFPFIFGKHDEQIIKKNNIHYAYYSILYKFFFCGMYEHLNMNIYILRITKNYVTLEQKRNHI